MNKHFIMFEYTFFTQFLQTFLSSLNCFYTFIGLNVLNVLAIVMLNVNINFILCMECFKFDNLLIDRDSSHYTNKTT